MRREVARLERSTGSSREVGDLGCIKKLKIPELKKDFCVVADFKLIDIMVGMQSTRHQLQATIALLKEIGDFDALVCKAPL